MTSANFINLNEYKVINQIGSGSFSKVYKVKSGDQYYVAKVSLYMVDENTKDEAETLSLFREVNLISFLNHPSILKFFGYSPTNWDGKPSPTIITELSTNGSLREIIEKEISGLSPEGWTTTKKLICIYGIASGLEYLHSNEVIHRDLKPENILMDDNFFSENRRLWPFKIN